MKHLAALTPFISAVAAIDGFLHTTPDCSINGGSVGSVLRCNNLRPDTCCGIDTIDSPFRSVAIRGIQDGYRVQLLGYDGGNCTNRQYKSENRGSSLICIPYIDLQYTGCGYSFWSPVRAISEGKAGCQRPNALVLRDGTEYDLSNLSDDDFKIITLPSSVDVSVKATKPADIPGRLKALDIK
ncbi:transcription factor [Fusarium beomiforme]|uniref:Transcription factor n=1 Tax=Fusarium beomiforme TaxID=44412 RepID=A0A9P5APA5_9HYPO|nr:transcription factor [Fusarium beomiforme]